MGGVDEGCWEVGWSTLMDGGFLEQSDARAASKQPVPLQSRSGELEVERWQHSSETAGG